MKRRDFHRFALGIGLSPILANAQVAGQTERKNVVADDPMAAVRKYVDAFNQGDAAAMATTFAVPGSILDGMAPHVWQGPTATQDWYRDVLIEGKQHDVSDYFITLGEPLHNNVTGDSAYVVVPATMTFKVRGKQVTQSGAVFTVALRKLAEGWRIAAWAWAKGTAR
jgi:ketosteroid isomerase-like protein